MSCIIGYRKNGCPIWSFTGGAPEEGDGGEGDGKGGEGGSEGEGGTEDELPDTVKEILARERSAAARAQKAYKPYAELAKQTGLTLEQMRVKLLDTKPVNDEKDKNGDKGPKQVDADALERSISQKLQKQNDARFVKVSVRAEAATVLADPDDAARFLDLSDYTVDDDGNVDSGQIKADLKALLLDRPYLGKKASKTDFDGGPRGRSASSGESMDDIIRRASGHKR